MGKLKDILDEYKDLFREIGVTITTSRILVLETLQDERLPISIANLADKTGGHRTEVYKAIRVLEQCGLVRAIERGEITPDEEAHIMEYSQRRHQSRDRKIVIRAARAIFNPLGLISHIDKRIQELEDFKGKIIAGEVFG